MSVLHIVARDIVQYDAVGNFCRQVAAVGRDMGLAVRLWAENRSAFSDCVVENRDGLAEAIRNGDTIFFSHSIFDPMLDQIAALPNVKMAYFHGITPPAMIDPSDVETVENCRRGWEQVDGLGGFDRLVVNSQATASELFSALSPVVAERLREQIMVVPPVGQFDRWSMIEAASIEPLPASLKLIYVGRLVPHKGLDDLLAIMDSDTMRVADVSLDIIGGPTGGAYVEGIRASAASDPRIALHQEVPAEVLKALCERASAFITLTHHEGFGVPALDALWFDKPIFVRPLPALLEVLGPAALVLPDGPETAAAAVVDFFANANRQSANAGQRAVRRIHWAERTERDIGALVEQLALLQ